MLYILGSLCVLCATEKGKESCQLPLVVNKFYDCFFLMGSY